MDQGCIKPLCYLLNVMDAKSIQVALNDLDAILPLVLQDRKLDGGTNPYAELVEECFGLC